MKKILLLFSLVLLVGCWNRNDIKKFKEEYESLNDGQIEVNINLDYQVTYLDSDETADFLNNDTLSAFLTSNDDGEKLLRTPDVYFVKDGEIVGNFYGSIDEFNDEELTDEQKEELYDHYNQLAKLAK